MSVVPLRVLLVEPDEDYAGLMVQLLARIGGEVERVTAAEGASTAGEEHAVAIVDVGVEVAEGRSLLRELRERTALPIIALSDGDGGETGVRRAIEHADYELVRPFSPRRFLAAVRAVTRRGRRAAMVGLPAEGTVVVGPLTLDLRSCSSASRRSGVRMTRWSQRENADVASSGPLSHGAR